ncbi:MAG: hypothetical protein JST86_04510 [Bacteroidetes bacterium]|nr:hypothetical protein [Bacteroidota bacterium]
MNKNFVAASVCITILLISSCNKQDALTPIPEPEVKQSYINFKQDTVLFSLLVTTALKESVGNINVTTIEGNYPDTTSHKNNLVIRITGDSARTYLPAEILASYTDSLGVTYANSSTDTMNKVTVTKLQKIKQGIVEGNFTIRVSNTTKTKTILLSEGKFATSFFE